MCSKSKRTTWRSALKISSPHDLNQGTKILVISIEKTFARIFLDRIGLVPVMTQTFCGLTGKLNFCVLWTVMLQSKLNVLGQARYLGSHQICGRVCVIAMLLKGKLLSLTILKTGLCSNGYVIGSMEKANLQRHPIMLVRFFSLMAIHLKPGNWLTNSRPVRKITRPWKN